jgi:hypothetical protein
VVSSQPKEDPNWMIAIGGGFRNAIKWEMRALVTLTALSNTSMFQLEHYKAEHLNLMIAIAWAFRNAIKWEIESIKLL